MLDGYVNNELLNSLSNILQNWKKTLTTELFFSKFLFPWLRKDSEKKGRIYDSGKHPRWNLLRK